MNIEELSEKHAKECAYAAHDKIGLYPQDQMWAFNVIRNALTEQAEAFKGELQAYDGMVRELTKTVEDMQAAQSVPVVGDVLFFASESTETADSQIRYDVCADKKDYSFFPVVRKPANSITAAELASLREKAAMVDELRKDAERYRWLRDPSVYVGKVIDKVAGYEPMTELGTGGYPIYEYRAGPELDEAIDAAIAQGKGE